MNFFRITVHFLLLFALPIGTLATSFRVTDEVFFDVKRDGLSLGRIVIGLFGELAPKSVKNFKVLATKGIKGKSYNGTIFFRIIKRHLIQGGDIVYNNGTGVASIYKGHFQDENLHSKHTVSGFVSMANNGKNSNGCQFFITTVGAPWLDQLHTIVGKVKEKNNEEVVEGQHVVHIIEHTPTDVDDRPLQDVIIVSSGKNSIKAAYNITDETYGLWAWIKASAVPLTMSFSILYVFHIFIKKLDIATN